MLPVLSLLPCRLALVAHAAHVACARARAFGERGQATAEYALVLLGAATIALLVAGWATQSNQIGQLLDRVLSLIHSKMP